VALGGQAKPLAPEELGLQPPPGGAMPTDYKAARERALDDFERDFIVHVLRAFDKNVSKAARESGIDRVYLHKLIKKHGIVVDEL
jgi:transcriptional regulator of acetoin/glycerol metabolism